MKVKELIEKLQQFDPELPVMVDGYEGGVNDLKKMTEIEVFLNCNTKDYLGKHEIVNDYLPIEKFYKKFVKAKAILLHRP